MRRSTFNVLFYVKKSQPRKNGQCPVMGRITIDGVAVQFSCKFEVDPRIWDADAGRATGRSEQARDANSLLDRIGASLTEHYREIVNRDGFVTAEKVKNAYLGMDMRCETLLKIFERHNEDYDKMVQSGSRSWRAFYRYQYVRRLLAEFIKQRYNRSDIALKEIQPAFITDFEFSCAPKKKHGNTTIWMYMMPLRRMITTAINNGWLYFQLHETLFAAKNACPQGGRSHSVVARLVTVTQRVAIWKQILIGGTTIAPRNAGYYGR